MSDSLDQAVHRLLRPLVRYLIGRGVTFTHLARLLKLVYVEESLARGGGRLPTDSDLSVASDIDCTEIPGVRRAATRHDRVRKATRDPHIAARLIGAWVSSADARKTDGNLKDLPFHSATGLSFETLAYRINADARPRAILDDLIRARAVSLEDGDHVRLLRAAYVPEALHHKLAFLADNVGDHMASAFHNLNTNSPFLERALFFDALPHAALQAARPRIEAAADRLLQDLRHDLTPLESDAAMDAPTRRTRIGVYYYEEDSSPVDTTP